MIKTYNITAILHNSKGIFNEAIDHPVRIQRYNDVYELRYIGTADAISFPQSENRWSTAEKEESGEEKRTR
jgi:hypothetical protein